MDNLVPLLSVANLAQGITSGKSLAAVLGLMYSPYAECGRMISPDGSSATPASEWALPASLRWPLGWIEGDALSQSLAQSLSQSLGQSLANPVKKTGVDLKLGETPDGEAKLLLSRQRLG